MKIVPIKHLAIRNSTSNFEYEKKRRQKAIDAFNKMKEEREKLWRTPIPPPPVYKRLYNYVSYRLTKTYWNYRFQTWSSAFKKFKKQFQKNPVPFSVSLNAAATEVHRANWEYYDKIRIHKNK